MFVGDTHNVVAQLAESLVDGLVVNLRRALSTLDDDLMQLLSISRLLRKLLVQAGYLCLLGVHLLGQLLVVASQEYNLLLSCIGRRCFVPRWIGLNLILSDFAPSQLLQRHLLAFQASGFDSIDLVRFASIGLEDSPKGMYAG